MKKKVYIKQMDKSTLEKISKYLQENGMSLSDIDLNELIEMERELGSLEKGLHIFDGYFDPTSPTFCDMRNRKSRH